jgi:hypothetical protein
MSPELAPQGWKPVFLDYLHLGFTNATAFSTTDVMPLTLRAKYIHARAVDRGRSRSSALDRGASGQRFLPDNP